MSEDWQETAFNTRHMHNRQSRGSRSSKSNSAFDVRKTFGSYEIKCPAWQKQDHVSTDDSATLQLYRLTENGLAVVGEMNLPGAMSAAVCLAGSRETMRRTMEELEGDAGNEAAEQNAHQPAEDSEEEEDADEDENDRFDTFEKNSFRTPKFWMKWKAVKRRARPSKKSKKVDAPVEGHHSVEGSGMGYLVFSGNQCRKFKGTITCAELGWKDVALAGHKEVQRSESDVPVWWGDVEM